MNPTEENLKIARVHCSKHDRLAELSLTLEEYPLPRHFSCGQALCYAAGVVCNYGGTFCPGFPEAVQELNRYSA